jgi:hypothetical protein
VLSTIKRLPLQKGVPQLLLTIVCGLVLVRTVVPTLYTLDSAELAAGAVTLGIVHAPGYPLYLLIAHLFTLLPIGDAAYRVNLFSAVCLAGTAPILFTVLMHLIHDRVIALCAALLFVWSYYMWTVSIVAEVYAPQVLMLTVCMWALTAMVHTASPTSANLVGVGVSIGLAVAMHPSTVLMGAAVVLVFRFKRIPWAKSVITACIGAVIFGVAQLYFPVRHAAEPEINMAGMYDATGTFHAVNLQSLDGILWLLRGVQFQNLFFRHGWIPPLEQFAQTFMLFWNNFLGFGFILGLVGLVRLFQCNRGVFWVWCAAFVPFTYFYTAYGAPDRYTMLGPAYVLWAIALAYGLQWALAQVQPLLKMLVCAALPCLLLMINFPLVDSSQDISIRKYATELMNDLPPQAAVVGVWWEIAPLEYLQTVEGIRPDVTLFNEFLFTKADKNRFLAYEIARSQRPFVVLSDAVTGFDLSSYYAIPLSSDEDSAGGYIIVPY